MIRIGYLGAETASGETKRLDALRASLRDLGYVEGKNIVIESRWADGSYDRLPALAAELVRLKVDVMVTVGTKGVLGAKHATTTIPIVMQSSGDIVSLGLVASLARPGGNITGSTNVGRELGQKRLQLLKDAVPHMVEVGYLVNPENPAFGPNLQALWATAKSLKLQLQPFEARGSGDFERAFSEMAKRRVHAVLLQDDTSFGAHASEIADLAAKHRLPLAAGYSFAAAGALLSYGPNLRETDRRAAYFVDRILKGANPGDLPIEQPTKFELVIDARKAKALGIKIPRQLLVRADKVIE